MSDSQLLMLRDFRSVTTKEIFLAKLNNHSFVFEFPDNSYISFFLFCTEHGFLRYVRSREHRGVLGEFVALDTFSFIRSGPRMHTVRTRTADVRKGDLVEWSWSLMAADKGDWFNRNGVRTHGIFDAHAVAYEKDVYELTKDIERLFQA